MPPGAPAPARSIPAAPSPRRAVHLALILILAIAAAFRLPALDTVPPGIHPDEAINAWNAYCLLTHGRDQTGAPWPVFYMRALGENRSTLFAYLVIPFQAIGGLNEWTMRLPNAVGGVLAVALLYAIAASLFDRAVGLLAALLLAISPWAVHLSRTGHEAGLVGLLAMVPVAALVGSGLVRREGAGRAAPGPALLGGLCSGLACYGYPAVRIFIPAFLIACAAGALLARLRTRTSMRSNPVAAPARQGRPARPVAAITALAIGFLVPFVPLAWMHVAHPDVMNRRAEVLWVWSATDSFAGNVGRIASRYVDHYLPGFLFYEGDRYEGGWCSGFGVVCGFAAPLMIAGLVVVARRAWHGDVPSCIVAAWLLAYPAGDVLTDHVSSHVLRAAPGLGVLALLAAVGGVTIARALLARRGYATLTAGATILALLAVEQTSRVMWRLLVVRSREVVTRELNMADLAEACRWIRPRLRDVDRICITTRNMVEPYIVAAVALRYDPADWFATPRDVTSVGAWDRYSRFGSIHFLFDRAAADVLAEQRRQPGRFLFVVREGEIDAGPPAWRIRSTAGHEDLLIYDMTVP